MQADLVIDARAQLGEGALWHTDTQRLFWVDIEGKTLRWFDPVANQHCTIKLPARIGTVVPTAYDAQKVVVALQNGIFSLHLETEQLVALANPLEGLTDMRFNDGKCDAAGRFWVGSMHLSAQQPNGILYRLDPDGELHPMLHGVTISNGITWSLDNQTMYYIDSATGSVQSCDYALDTGTFDNMKTAVVIPKQQGMPDGMTIDEEGMLWIAHWGSSSVGRYDPHQGKLIQRIEVPAPFVTSCAFGGDQLDILYITTARKDMDEHQLNTHPLCGGLFAVEAGVRGVPAHTYKRE